MFIPIEGALSDALRKRNDLAEYALGRNVTIATPTTLMMAMRTVRNLLDVERRTENAEAIADRGGKLYDKIVLFAQDMEKVGKQIANAQEAHLSAVSKLTTGRGNVLGQVQRLKDLGAKTNKSLPDSLTIEKIE